MIADLPRALRSSSPPCPDTLVLKFGSSLLSEIGDASAVANEISRLATRAKVVVVVSAFKGETDRLFRLAGELSGNPCERLLPKLILTGEEQAASAVALACAERGLQTDLLPIADLGFFASGHPLASLPLNLDPWPLTQVLDGHDVVVVPGFGARCGASGRHVLLGRGGSDLTAVMIAAALKLPRVRLLKDVDGIYTRDPNQHKAARLDRVDWAEAKQIAGKLVQPEALALAERQGIFIEIATQGSDAPSVIGPCQLALQE